MKQVAFIGLGAMGQPMARNLIRAGYSLAVYARRAESRAALTALGAREALSPADAARNSDIVVTMVTDTAAVQQVLLGADGVVQGAAAGTVVIDHSTIDPRVTSGIAAVLAERRIPMLDAPVSGGVMGAEAGTLVMMVGGDEAVFERCAPVLAVNASRRVFMGPSGSGQVAKACTQLCIVVNQLALAEAMMLAERGGLDPLRLIDALQGGFAASRIVEVQGPKMAARDFTGRIESRLHYKDIGLTLELARALGVATPAAALAADVMGRLQDAGGARLDSAAVLTVLERDNAATGER